MHGRIHIFLLKLAVCLAVYGCGSRLWALDAATMQAMVIVEGDEGRGSAFVVKIGDKTYLVTNSHVVRGNRNVKFKNLRNAEIPAGEMEIADAIDAVRMEIPAPPHALELEPDMDKIKIGEKVVGIGPDRVEVDAEFVPGNSGSPILLKSTGKVIGLATYVKFSFGAWFGGRKNPFSLGEVRRFGYRLDTVEKWIHPSAKDRLAFEGLKLAEMACTISDGAVAEFEGDAHGGQGRRRENEKCDVVFRQDPRGGRGRRQGDEGGPVQWLLRAAIKGVPDGDAAVFRLVRRHGHARLSGGVVEIANGQFAGDDQQAEPASGRSDEIETRALRSDRPESSNSRKAIAGPSKCGGPMCACQRR